MTADDRPRTIRDGLVPLGPEDTYGGVKVSSFCMACRDAIARYEHGMQASVELCAEDSAKVARAMSSVHVVGDKPAEFFQMAHVAIGTPAPAHPAPWRWDSSNFILRDANGTPLLVSNLPPDQPGAAETRARIAAAGEMEAILRELVKDADDEDRYAIRDDADNARALLARIDAARAG